MKIAFSASENTMDSPLDQRFGRAAMFIVYDTDKDTFTVVDNTQNLNAAQGAGIQSAQNVVNAGAKVLITGHTGPKAFRVLEAAKVETYLCPSGTVQNALDAWKKGELKMISEADVEGHWV